MSSTPTEVATENGKRNRRSQKRIDKCVESLLNSSAADSDQPTRLADVCRLYAESVEENKQIGAQSHKLQQRLETLVREKTSLETERNKALLARTRLESLCRQLQKQNKQVKEEGVARLRGEEERRREATGKFQTALAEITALMAQKEQKNDWLADENKQMAEKLKHLCDKYEQNNTAVETLIKQKDLELQLSEARLVKLQKESAEQKKTLLLEKHSLLTELASYQTRCADMQKSELTLREQLRTYSAKYDQFSSTMAQSNQMFADFKAVIDKMQTNMKRMERDNAVWRKRCETASRQLAAASGANSQLQQQLEASHRQLATLQRLCRALQARAPSTATDNSAKSDAVGLSAGTTGSDSAVPPAETAVSPAETAVSPAETAVSPAEIAVSPAVSPAETAVSPAETAVSPAEIPVSPTETAVSPAEIAVSPAETTVSPAETAVSPAETAVSSVETAVPLTETGVNSAETAVSPAETAVSPPETAVSPAETAVSPAETAASPAETAVSPVETSAYEAVNRRFASVSDTGAHSLVSLKEESISSESVNKMETFSSALPSSDRSSATEPYSNDDREEARECQSSEARECQSSEARECRSSEARECQSSDPLSVTLNGKTAAVPRESVVSEDQCPALPPDVADGECVSEESSYRSCVNDDDEPDDVSEDSDRSVDCCRDDCAAAADKTARCH